mgnify:CR=1 FL=1
MKDSIKALRELEKRLYAYQYAMAVADYDSETVAPPESSAGRAEAMEVLSRAYFDQLVSADTAALLQRAAADAETEQDWQDSGRRVRRVHKADAGKHARMGQGKARQ